MADLNLALIPVASIGTEKALAHVNRGSRHHGWGMIDTPRWPDSPEGRALRVLRLVCDLGLREAAKVLGLSPSDLSALERGSATLSPEDWNRVFVALADDWTRRNPPRNFDFTGGDRG